MSASRSRRPSCWAACRISEGLVVASVGSKRRMASMSPVSATTVLIVLSWLSKSLAIKFPLAWWVYDHVTLTRLGLVLHPVGAADREEFEVSTLPAHQHR